MNKRTTLFKVLFFVIAIITSLSSKADTYTYTFSGKVWSAYGTQTLGTASWTAAATGGGYWGYDVTKGHQFGSSGSPATQLSLTTSAFTGTITSVKVNTSGASSIVGNVGVTVGSTAFTSSGASSQTLSATATDYTFVGSGTGNLTISWAQTSSKALYIKSIEVTYSAAVSSVPVVTAATTSGVYGSAMSYNVVATNSPSSYAIASGSLPAGVSLNTTTGQISGTPTETGAFVASITATNSVGVSTPAAITVNISKASQAISFAALDSKTSQDVAFALNATASSGLSVSYASSNPAVATVSGNTVSITGVGTTTITASQAGNENYAAATSVDQVLTVAQYVAPTISITEVTSPEFNANAGATDAQTFYVAGSDLTADVAVSISGANADQFSVSQASVSQAAGAAPNTVIAVTYNPTSAGTHTAQLKFSSAGAVDVTRSLVAIATTSSLDSPIALEASSISNTGFTANWSAVSGATEYQLDVTSVVSAGNSTTVLSDDFSGFSKGTTNASADATDVATSLDTYTKVSGWTGAKVYQAGGAIKLGASTTLGSISTPAIDLSSNSGNFDLSFKGMAWSGDSTKVKVYVNNVLAKTISGLSNDASYTMKSFAASISGGNAATIIRLEGNQASKGRFFIDDLVISQASNGTSTSEAPISGSPFTVTDLSKVISGLSAGSTYKYTVTAKNTSLSSVKSNVITVNTLSTGLSTPETMRVAVVNGTLIFDASAGEVIELYNSLGQKLYSAKSIEGVNAVKVHNKGMVVLRLGNTVTKVIL